MNSYELVFSYQGPCDRFTHSRTTTVDGTTRQYTLTGLQEFSTYTINITAANGGGRSAVASQSVTTIVAGKSYFGSVLLLASLSLLEQLVGCNLLLFWMNSSSLLS